MSPFLSTILSGIFLLAGALAVYTLMALQGGRTPANPRLYLNIHRAAGWVFVILFAVVFLFMMARVKDYWEEHSPRIAIHVTLSVALVALLAAKVLIPRLFPKLKPNLLFLGLTVYILSFTMVGITAGYYLIWRYEESPRVSRRELPAHMLVESLGKELFIERCSVCHVLKEIMTPRSADAWEKVINDMIAIAEPRITHAEGEQILHYLAQTHQPKHFEGTADSTPVQRHCLPCHDATEVFAKRYTREGWTAIVRQMTEYDPQTVPPEKYEEITNYLLRTQQNR